MPRVLVPLAEGFEEIEAVTLVDVLRRAAGTGAVRGSHGIALQADAALDAALQEAEARPFDMVVLPGGEPGTTHLAADARLSALLQRFGREGRPIGAICAAPRLLAAEGLLRGRAATSHPSVEAQVRRGGARYGTERVVRDGELVTSRGPGTALEFALGLLEVLGVGDRAGELRRAMLAAVPG